jgi:hypothetical protein
MARVRIRTLKPENWADEGVGDVSRDARLLRDVLVTFADDDGRWRHRASEIIGHGYPNDDDVTAAKIAKWAAELVAVRLIHLYEANGKPYGCFPKWHRHQSMQKYQASDLPSPDDIETVPRRSKDDPQSVYGTSAADPPAHVGVAAPRSVPDPEEPQAVVAGAVASFEQVMAIGNAAAIKRHDLIVFDASVYSVLIGRPDGDHIRAANDAAADAVSGRRSTSYFHTMLKDALDDQEQKTAKVTPLRGPTLAPITGEDPAFARTAREMADAAEPREAM